MTCWSYRYSLTSRRAKRASGSLVVGSAVGLLRGLDDGGRVRVHRQLWDEAANPPLQTYRVVAARLPNGTHLVFRPVSSGV